MSRFRPTGLAAALADVVIWSSQLSALGQEIFGGDAMNIILSAIGALGAIWYVGYFAFAVNELPLTIIVAICLSLMLFAMYRDLKKDRAIAEAKRQSGR